MNEIERRFYTSNKIRDISVVHLSKMKEVFQEILKEIREENPYTTIEDILSEPTDEESQNFDEF